MRTAVVANVTLLATVSLLSLHLSANQSREKPKLCLEGKACAIYTLDTDGGEDFETPGCIQDHGTSSTCSDTFDTLVSDGCLGNDVISEWDGNATCMNTSSLGGGGLKSCNDYCQDTYMVGGVCATTTTMACPDRSDVGYCACDVDRK